MSNLVCNYREIKEKEDLKFIMLMLEVLELFLFEGDWGWRAALPCLP
jgi:hypothetical protein